AQSVYIEDLTWPEVKAAIAAGKTTAILYAGSTEQNGPHLALGKHNFVAHYAAGEIAKKLGNALVYPTMPFAPTGSRELRARPVLQGKGADEGMPSRAWHPLRRTSRHGRHLRDHVSRREEVDPARQACAEHGQRAGHDWRGWRSDQGHTGARQDVYWLEDRQRRESDSRAIGAEEVISAPTQRRIGSWSATSCRVLLIMAALSQLLIRLLATRQRHPSYCKLVAHKCRKQTSKAGRERAVSETLTSPGPGVFLRLGYL